MNEAKMKELVNELARVKSEQNVLAALAIYHPEAELVSPSFEATAVGSEEVHKQLGLFFLMFPDYQVALEHYAINGSIMLATATVMLSANIPGKTTPQIELPVFLEFHFKENRISKEVFHLDAGLICSRSGISEAEFKETINTYLTVKNMEVSYA